jgi:lysophospholipase L1-like esterase
MPKETIRIFLVGDSTMSDKILTDTPEHGWGQMFPLFFKDNVKIINFAKNGRSTKSFRTEGRWKLVYDQLRPGDYVFIQFGHNDAKKEDTSRFAAPRPDYKENLIRYIRDVREKKAVPILLTPITRREFDEKGTYIGTHGEYPAVMKEVAKEENVPLIDMFEKTKKYISSLGDEASKPLYLKGTPPNAFRHWSGKRDDTHFSRAGAIRMGEFVVEGIHELHLPLESALAADTIPKLPASGKVVGLDNYYNNEWKIGKDSVMERFHYLWDDTANSGFSQLGRNIDWFGADLDTLQSAPTDSSLGHFSIYIIVDPDTPDETKSPHYIETKDINVIEHWVGNGGVLVLLANDKGNCELEHLNLLAGRFGIHFNEDHWYMVKNNKFDMGRVEKFPDHPAFKGVHQMYLKEISSLSLKEPAQALLKDTAIVIMATAKYGKGLVFAVGDPWLYNEYFDNRKLPAGYENAAAGKELFRWLLSIAPVVKE